MGIVALEYEMGSVMKTIKVEAPYNISIVEAVEPSISGPDDVLIKVKLAGICGSDLHIYNGTSPVAAYPIIPGHEIVGVVLDTGTNVSKLEKGDHVVVDPVISCGTCYQCKIGRINVCGNLKVRGASVDGGYQEYVVVPQNSVYKFPDSLGWEEALMIEPFAVAAQTVARGEITGDDIVLIIGAGPAGLSVLQAVKNLHAACIISDRNNSRLTQAKCMGADMVLNPLDKNIEKSIASFTRNRKPSVVIDAVGTAATLEQAVKIVSGAGRLVVLGFDKSPSQICQFDITKSELDVRGSRLHCNKLPQVIDWFDKGSINAKPFITHKFLFTEVREAFELIERKPAGLLKAALVFK